MPLDYDSVISYRTGWTSVSYDVRDVILYALGVGYGREDLDFVLERRGPKVLPTLATTLVKSISRDLGLDMTGVVHAAQCLDVLAPLPAEADIVWQAAVTDVIDKGQEKGAIVVFDTTARQAENGPDLFVLRNTLMARRDGGCGGPGVASSKRQPVPSRDADIRHVIQTHADQALLYRLNGDMNPLHVDPEVAENAGFPKPILHGLCTYGIACRAIVERVCANDPTRIRRFEGRFTAPVYPGESITTEIWEGEDVIRLRCSIDDRDVTIFDDGFCLLSDAMGN